MQLQHQPSAAALPSPHPTKSTNTTLVVHKYSKPSHLQNGKSGGIVATWDTFKFHMTSSIIGDGFLALTGKWLSIGNDCLFIVVYAPQALNRKKKLWLDIEALCLITKLPLCCHGRLQ
ncbi:hypothetical protein Tco_1064664 [Tanacetum coccineum]